ncbi:tetratricopeptide repeat protein [Iodobacter ciconiae]|uniref:Tetratricopeptide repeat protein n=1 Tax=Iodobacter ciconiae TaxID=2496266 RepID=A0A3S8ZTQ2_9NEIS|nr:tetratricopeptide repeat protein [Iodobacter ciconiae]AZN36824.1 tetratricopeptide repeat protein [Iodobacter ciconiae]
MLVSSVDQLIQQAKKLISSRSVDSLTFATQARDLAVEMGCRFSEAAALTVYSSVLQLLGRHREAIDVLDKVLGIAETDELGVWHGEALQLMGRHAYTLGEYESAARYWCHCLELSAQAIETTQRLCAHIGLGQLYYAHEQFEVALIHHKMAQDLAKKEHDANYQSICLINIAVDLFRLNRLDDAMAIARQALPLVRAEDNYELEAEVYSVFGLIRLARGDIERARMNFLVALKINRLHINTWNEAANLLALGRCSLANAEYEAGLDELQRAFNLAEVIESQYLLAEIHEAFAVIYQKMNQPDLHEKHEATHRHLRSLLLEQSASAQLRSMEMDLPVPN